MSTTGAGRRTDPQTVIEEVRSLLGKSMQGNVRLFNRLSDLVKEATEQLGADTAKGRLPKGNELLARLLDLNFAYYSLLTDHGIAFLDELLSAAERTLGVKPSAKQEDQTAQASRIQINLTARAGEVAVAPFVIENQYPSALEVSFQAGDFVSLRGEIVSANHIRFEPPSLPLQPKEQAIIKSIVTIADAFKVGETYITTINVIGFQAKDIALMLTILPGQEEKKPRPSAAGKKKPRARQTKKGRKGEQEAQP